MGQHLLQLQQISTALQLPLLPLHHLHMGIEFPAIGEGKLPKQVLILFLDAAKEHDSIGLPFLQQFILLQEQLVL